jgi:hypothetical protein
MYGNLGYGLFYPPSTLAPEIVMLIFFIFWQYGRLNIGKFYLKILHNLKKDTNK